MLLSYIIPHTWHIIQTLAKSSEIMSPTSHMDHPFLCPIWVRVEPDNPPCLGPRSISLWAWASRCWVCCGRSPSTRAWGVTTWPEEWCFLCWGVPLGHLRSRAGLRWALGANFGPCGLGWGHVARDIVWAWLLKLSGRVSGCAKRVSDNMVSMLSCVDIVEPWRADDVHFYCLLRHVIGGGEGHVRGVMRTGLAKVVGLWSHPTLEPIPPPLGLLPLILIQPTIVSTRDWFLLLLYQKSKIEMR